jgi:hypothetical protein
MTIKNPNLLNQCLKEAGIRPVAFSYFLSEFIKREESDRKPGAVLLTKSLKAQAELIIYHLER